MSDVIELSALDTSSLLPGAFSVPWKRGVFSPTDACLVSKDGGLKFDNISTKPIAFWDDGSVKWTSHTVNFAEAESIQIKKSTGGNDDKPTFQTTETDDLLSISNAAGLKVHFNRGSGKHGNNVIKSIELDNKVVSSNVAVEATTSTKEEISKSTSLNLSIDKVTIETETKEKIVVLSTGTLTSSKYENSFIDFKLRTYLYSHNDIVKFTFSIIYSLDVDERLTSLGLSFEKSLAETPLYDRHIKITGAEGSVMSESALSITGLRRAASSSCREKQAEGHQLPLPDDPEWNCDVSILSHVPSFDEYSLTQLSSNGFEISKKFKDGFSKVKIGGGRRNDGCLFVGSPQEGGLNLGVSKFWEKYPGELSVKGFAGKGSARINLWLYSPHAEPLDVSPYYDGLGQDTYESQLDGLWITYEDYEPGFCDPKGVSRSFEVFLKPTSPSSEIISKKEFSEFVSGVRNPPLYIANLPYIHSTEVLPFWKPSYKVANIEPSEKETEIEGNLKLLFDYYAEQVDLHDWYGFWDYGDFQHTPDTFRHQWRYDVGGFAWDNSELSTDLWLWLYFLHTGDSKVFRTAEAMTKHTGEVDVYHIGKFKGFGTRHGVQHWSDSSKQLRISNVLFRRFYYYLSGGDERTGELMQELANGQRAMLGLDSHRKVQAKDPHIPDGYALANIGLDWGSIIGSWMTCWERRTDDWENAKKRLLNSIDSLTKLKHGLANNAVYMNVTTGDCIGVPPPTPDWAISHLTTVFGMNESVTELLQIVKHIDDSLYQKFLKFWTEYAICFNGSPELQKKTYGFEFPLGNISLQQSHARCTAHVSWLFGNKDISKEAWDQFFNTDGYTMKEWNLKKLQPYDSLSGAAEEAEWNSTNITAQYGISAIYMLAYIGDSI